jgi:MFS transporter, DHA2 family, methylenomycin A resistance protein
MAFGVLDVLAPLRLSQLGATPIVIGGTFLASAAVETGLSPLTGRLSDRSGPYLPIRISLLAGIAVSLLAPLLAPAPLLIALLIVGMPAFGALFAPATAMLSNAAHRLELNQGLAFGMANLAWAGGQVVSASASGAIAQATTDLVPYSLLAGVCLATLIMIRRLRPSEPGALRRPRRHARYPWRDTGHGRPVRPPMHPTDPEGQPCSSRHRLSAATRSQTG